MTLKKICTLALMLPSLAFGEALNPKFFANRDFQDQFPGAFALQSESQEFVVSSLSQTFADADTLVSEVQQRPWLDRSISRFPHLNENQRLFVMRTLFDLQSELAGTAAPELVLDNEAKQAAFFDFDLVRGGPGRVILNPKELFKDTNPYAALMFLIHETRHSHQFQQAQKLTQVAPSTAQAYSAAFAAQKRVFDQSLKISFCDFLTLNNEYEAFLFGNYVMEELTAGTVETKDMGTWASQYVPGEGLRIDLPKLFQEAGAPNVLDAFNELEMTQYKEMVP